MLQRRLQILIDDARYQRLQDRARDRGTSVAAVIRDLVDTGLPASDAARREAADFILNGASTPVPDDPRDIRREIEAAHEARFPG